MSSGNAAEPDEKPIFAAVLKPHRSLSSTGFMLVMMALVACSFTAGLAFWLMGAWPVVGFFGLDILLVQLAFRLNYRAARAVGGDQRLPRPGHGQEDQAERASLGERCSTPTGRGSKSTGIRKSA